MTIADRGKFRKRVWDKTDGHCAYCGKKLDITSAWHVDHIEPRSRGGTDNIGNLIASCPNCNTRKGTRTPFNFEIHLIDELTDTVNKVVGSLEQLREYQTDEDHTEINTWINQLVRIPDKILESHYPVFYHKNFPNEENAEYPDEHD